MSSAPFRKGDTVEVRSAAEILATLDADSMLEGVPFMPEMVEHCGRRFSVAARAEKLCDTITMNSTSRRLERAVLLDDLRCDGSGHDGCQAECLYYWKEAWLRPAGSGAAAPSAADDPATAELERLTERGAVRTGDDGVPVRFRCQATEMVAATTPLSTVDPRPYIRELTSGNVSPGRFLRVTPRAVVMQVAQKISLLPSPALKGPSAKTPAAPPPLDLAPGEWVRIKSREEIQATLNDKGMNRGLWFDREMAALCGKTFRVRRRVTQIVDERNGEMLNFGSDCIMLDGGVCSSDLSPGRWFCPRAIYSYWRECWLERVEAPADRLV